MERIPDEPAPFPARIAGQPRSGRAALGEGVEIGNPLDLSVQPIGTVMVHAAEVLRVAQPFRPQPVSAVKADVGEGPDRAVMLADDRSEEHTSELQPPIRLSYAVFCM